jgi:Ser/Thr protein kinase RdoA (MazF antagonist)
LPERIVRQLDDADSALVAGVLSSYGLSGPVSDVARVMVWGDRLVVAFTAPQGRFFLKEWPGFCETEDEIAFCLDIQETARERGVPAPRIYRTTHGDRTHVTGTRRFSLHEFVGKAYDPARSAAQIASCARVLGRLHRVTATVEIGGKRWRDDPFDLSRESLDRATTDLERARWSSAARRQRLQALERLSLALTHARREMERLGWWEVAVQPIHGDYCQFNCRFRGDGVAAIIDWDHARLAPRISDVAHALNVTLGWAREIDYYEDFRWRDARPLRPDEVGVWLARYCQSAGPLTVQEARLLPWACLAHWPRQTAGFALEDVGNPDGPDLIAGYVLRLQDDVSAFVDAAMALVV